jgi:hypothetical protein
MIFILLALFMGNVEIYADGNKSMIPGYDFVNVIDRQVPWPFLKYFLHSVFTLFFITEFLADDEHEPFRFLHQARHVYVHGE